MLYYTIYAEIKLHKPLNEQYYEAYAIIAGYAFSFTTVYGLRFSFMSEFYEKM